jgi:hypothetical protein
MWSNLLSGTIGAVIGVTRREDSRQARAEYALRLSGDLAAHLVDETAQSGRDDKYFVAKTSGRPAPIHVFFPADGSAPKILDFGSL